MNKRDWIEYFNFLRKQQGEIIIIGAMEPKSDLSVEEKFIHSYNLFHINRELRNVKKVLKKLGAKDFFK
jgi:hypothetical protein